MRIREFESELILPLSREQVFLFFADATNLEAITPPWLHFHILTPMPIEMRAGVQIDYRLKIHGWPVRWRSRISVWDPPHRFVDEQILGPYRLWQHTHEFLEVSGGTRVRDHVRYAVPMDWLLHRLFVRRDLEEIFRYRAMAIRRHCLQSHASHATAGPCCT
ncbi:MAG: SRPBCC family protein [Verrucomicrobiota bacterium]|nr:SRPBCC family protein [Limisphaera sp.]MDW8380603.1 SRPBCC family protein [Verrucomicrobiota bacterium]